ncbi:MAG: XRE family transcriptional regulator, partial [Lachnospiraceae bacterium]|nr:XRE family transcriptional regulator [Lachnospiraceae bacterium]
LDEVRVYGTELWRRDDKKPHYQTALRFTADGEDFPQKLSRVMIADPDRGGNWFADFKGGDTKYIVFRDLVLSYRIGDALAKAAVCEECRKRGVEEGRMNWEE